MKVETKFNKIKSLPDDVHKLSALYSLGFKMVPGGTLFNEVMNEIRRLRGIGVTLDPLFKGKY